MNTTMKKLVLTLQKYRGKHSNSEGKERKRLQMQINSLTGRIESELLKEMGELPWYETTKKDLSKPVPPNR